MRCMPASHLKSQKRRGPPLRSAPGEGTHLRDFYDLLQASRGRPVEWQAKIKTDATAVTRLTDFYGLDIRRVQNGNSRTGRKSLYVLAGEWFGKVYVDYIAEHLASLEKRDAA